MNEIREKEFFQNKKAEKDAEALRQLSAMSVEERERNTLEEEARKKHDAKKSRAAIKTRAAYGNSAAQNAGLKRGGRGGRGGRGDRGGCGGRGPRGADRVGRGRR